MRRPLFDRLSRLIWALTVPSWDAFSQTEEGDASSEKLEAQKEVKELQAQNSALTRKGQHQHEEIRRLNKVRHQAFSDIHWWKGSLILTLAVKTL